MSLEDVTNDAHQRITPQAVGAYGEKSVEAELLRRNWIAANVNASIKNAADFDIFALKKHKAVQIRVKTCGPGMNEFQFSFKPDDEIVIDELNQSDFTVLVAMGETRETDSFYVVPTSIVRDIIRRYKKEYLAQPKRDGNLRKDTGHWALHLFGLKSGEERVNYDLGQKWSRFRNNWNLLESENDENN